MVSYNGYQMAMFVGLCIFIFFCVYIYSLNSHTISTIQKSCYFSEIDDALRSAEDPEFSPKAKSIFFHETSCKGGLDPRQACAVESAARAHPHWQVYVLFSSPVTNHMLKNSSLAYLLQFHNVNFVRVHMAEYSKGTPAQSILVNDLINSTYPIQHAADVLRMVTLNKWGGIYLDTDMIVTRSLETLPSNFIAKETDEYPATGIMSFTKDEVGKNITNMILSDICEQFDETSFSYNGGWAVKRVIDKLCPEHLGNTAGNPTSYCGGITIFDFELFYPYYFDELKNLLTENLSDDFDLERPYTYHMWNYFSNSIKSNKNSSFDLIAKTFCPTIYAAYPEQFGFLNVS